MTKLEFINFFANRNNTSKKAATETVENMIETITDVLVSGDDISIVGFGSLEVKHKSERNGVNPKTGEPIVIPARKAVTFKAGKNLKQKINS